MKSEHSQYSPPHIFLELAGGFFLASGVRARKRSIMWKLADTIQDVRVQKDVCRVQTAGGMLLDVACLDTTVETPRKGGTVEVEVREKLPRDLNPWPYVARGQRVAQGAAAETLSCGGLLLTASPDHAPRGAWPPLAYVLAKWAH